MFINDTDTLIKQVKIYLKLLNSSVGTKWDKGYFWSRDEATRAQEQNFLEVVPKFEREIRKILRTHPEDRRAIYLATALGWGHNKKENGRVLLNLLLAGPHPLHNYAMRAAFPLIVTQKIPFSLQEALSLLQHKSPYCKNKALGTLVFVPLKKREIEILKHRVSYFKKLSKTSIQLSLDQLKCF